MTRNVGFGLVRHSNQRIGCTFVGGTPSEPPTLFYLAKQLLNDLILFHLIRHFWESMNSSLPKNS